MMRPEKHWQGWSAEDEALLARLYPDAITSQLAQQFGRSLGAVQRKATKMGLRKSEGFWKVQWHESRPQFLARKKDFPKGNRPGNAMEIGEERVHDGGYLWVKVCEGSWPKAWRPKHRLVWEAAHGPIPKGYVLWFKDRDKRNCVLENLELITMKEVMSRNAIHNLPEDLKQCIRMVGAINRRLNHAKP